MSLAIETRGLTKRYGSLLAVQELDLQVEAGSVFGFVGPNGAGKTTTMRILATLLRPTAGKAWVAGRSVLTEQREVRRLIGYMPDSFGAYSEMKTWEYLDFFAACNQVPAAQRRPLVDSLLELVELAHRRDDAVGSLSRGMRQRLCLARALAHDPAVLILDEPASGLDPRARVEIRELLKELCSMGKTILISSHILSEIEEVCTHVGIIESGRLVAAGSIAEMRRRLEGHRLVHTALLARVQAAQVWLENRQEILEVNRVDAAVDDPDAAGELQAVVSGDDRALAALLADMVAAGLPLVSFREDTDDLEDIFLRLTAGVVS